jgi:hypothetical protein
MRSVVAVAKRDMSYTDGSETRIPGRVRNKREGYYREGKLMIERIRRKNPDVLPPVNARKQERAVVSSLRELR